MPCGLSKKAATAVWRGVGDESAERESRSMRERLASRSPPADSRKNEAWLRLEPVSWAKCDSLSWSAAGRWVSVGEFCGTGVGEGGGGWRVSSLAMAGC